MGTPRALSLLEVLVSVTLVAALAGLAAVGVTATRAGIALQEAAVRLETARLEARSQVNEESFPTDVSLWSSQDIPVVSGVPAQGEVSGFTPQTDTAVLSSWAGDSCLVLIEKLGEVARWGVRPSAEACSADTLWAVQSQVTGTRQSPSEVS